MEVRYLTVIAMFYVEHLKGKSMKYRIQVWNLDTNLKLVDKSNCGILMCIAALYSWRNAEKYAIEIISHPKEAEKWQN